MSAPSRWEMLEWARADPTRLEIWLVRIENPTWLASLASDMVVFGAAMILRWSLFRQTKDSVNCGAPSAAGRVDSIVVTDSIRIVVFCRVCGSYTEIQTESVKVLRLKQVRVRERLKPSKLRVGGSHNPSALSKYTFTNPKVENSEVKTNISIQLANVRDQERISICWLWRKSWRA